MNDENDAYYSQARPEMLRFIPDTTTRLLDIGCSEGVKRKLPGCETWGVEAEAPAAAKAKTRNDKVFNCRIDEATELPERYFDVITMNDVLEHIDYAEPVLARVKQLLRPDGRLVLSLPNVRYYLNVRDLLFKKDWKYEDYGVLDRTHLRFYTQKSAARYLAENGFKVVEIMGINAPRLAAHYRALFALAPGFFDDMRYRQFAVVALPTS